MCTKFTLKNDIGCKAIKEITHSLLQYQLLWPNETDKRGTQNRKFTPDMKSANKSSISTGINLVEQILRGLYMRVTLQSKQTMLKYSLMYSEQGPFFLLSAALQEGAPVLDKITEVYTMYSSRTARLCCMEKQPLTE